MEPEELDGDKALVEGGPDELDAEPEVLRVRYRERSDFRILSARDLSGDPALSDEPALTWAGNGAEVPWDEWERYAGSRERALSVLRAHAHEFELVGPGADELEPQADEEFAIGGTVD